ncbi:uncharacterized protein LOC130629979 [Hydractinia symbiolongicarpus]|uniref:uncharacterized protein LOC130629979 n=1 Tax=Hydractinia symbiolongicarpus TaxID=13093 RepID=UPI002551A764|nr:uncharacterized protein LOC130629979 [Hydractinia symbiolongicarpus]
MSDVLGQKKSLKTQATLWVKWVREDTSSTDAPCVHVDKAFNSYMEILHAHDDISDVFDRMCNKIIEQIENPALPASGFTIDKILHMHVDFHELKLTRGSSYLPLPKNFSGKRSVINPHNEDDDKCFRWAIIAALNHDKIDNHPERISILKKHDKYNWDGLTFPMALNKIDLFERRNPDIAVHVLTKDEGEGIYMCRKSKHLDRKETVVLFLLCEGDKRHYIAVKNLSGVLSKANSKHKNKEYYCLNCLYGFQSEQKRDEHFEYCKNNDAAKIQLPKEGSTLTFTDGKFQLKAPFIMYADFEAFTKELPEDERKCGSSTEKVGKHVPTGFCCYSKYAHGEVPDPLNLYCGEDCVPRFVDHVVSEAKRLYNMFPQKAMDPLTDEERDGFNRARVCHICMEEFDDKDDIKVRDHCHFTGKFRGAAHQKCNLRYKVPNYIPVVFHNLSGYDAHLFIKELARKYGEDGMGVIAENKEKYISFSTDVKVGEYIDKNGETKDRKIQLRFIDSFRFMSSGLSSLADNLSDDQCKNLRKFFNGDEFNIMRRKGVYPYEYVNSFDRFNETELPSKDDFYSKLNMNGIIDADYAHAQKVWKDMKVENMGVYHDIYLKTDVLLLSDVFETFRETCLRNYDLDPAHFYTAPGLAWRACLKKTKVSLDLLSDMEMVMFIESGIRGGLCQAVHRYAKANNKYMGDEYNTSDGNCMDLFEQQEMAKTVPFVKRKLIELRYWLMKHVPRVIKVKTSKAYRAVKDKIIGLYEKVCWGPSVPKEEKQYTTKANTSESKEMNSYLQYLDANNLYGWAMIQKMPTGGFEWVDDVVSDFTPELISQLAVENGEKGYILEVDVSYPRELHDSHNDLPFMPERKIINGVEKLTPCLSDKKKYITHIRALDQALKHGLVLEKVHRVLRFDQSAWLKSYIDFNTDLRTKSTNDFEKDFFKLMNNSVFGKTMENQRRQKDIRLATKKEQYEKLVMKPNFKGSTWFSETLMGIEMSKIKIKMNKPIYLGLAILDLSKIVMYEFHYDYMRPKYGVDVKLCYMDTDSFVYHIKTDDFYKDIADDVALRFDTSGYDKKDGRPLPLGLNKKIIGLMKDELGGKGAVKKFDYPKYVWSPTGGWWCQPRNWKRNTAIAFIASALISIPIIKWGRENEIRYSHRLPKKEDVSS